MTVEEAEAQLADAVSLYLNGGRLTGTPTTLVDMTCHEPKILREGMLPAEEVFASYER